MTTEKQIQIVTCGLTKLTIKNLDVKILYNVRRDLALNNNIFPNVLCDIEPLRYLIKYD